MTSSAAERAQERAALTLLEDAPGAERTVVCGLEPTLAMLQQRRVELLLIAEGARFTAGMCPLCGRVSTSRRRCEVDGTSLISVDALAHGFRELDAVQHGPHSAQGVAAAIGDDRPAVDMLVSHDGDRDVVALRDARTAAPRGPR